MVLNVKWDSAVLVSPDHGLELLVRRKLLSFGAWHLEVDILALGKTTEAIEDDDYYEDESKDEDGVQKEAGILRALGFGQGYWGITLYRIDIMKSKCRVTSQCPMKQ
jgi:hypothetical protein